MYLECTALFMTTERWKYIEKRINWLSAVRAIHAMCIRPYNRALGDTTRMCGQFTEHLLVCILDVCIHTCMFMDTCTKECAYYTESF